MCVFSVNNNSFRRLRPVVDWQSFFFIKSSMLFKMPFDEFLVEFMKFKNLLNKLSIICGVPDNGFIREQAPNPRPVKTGVEYIVNRYFG